MALDSPQAILEYLTEHPKTRRLDLTHQEWSKVYKEIIFGGRLPGPMDWVPIANPMWTDNGGYVGEIYGVPVFIGEPEDPFLKMAREYVEEHG